MIEAVSRHMWSGGEGGRSCRVTWLAGALTKMPAKLEENPFLDSRTDGKACNVCRRASAVGATYRSPRTFQIRCACVQTQI